MGGCSGLSRISPCYKSPLCCRLGILFFFVMITFWYIYPETFTLLGKTVIDNTFNSSRNDSPTIENKQGGKNKWSRVELFFIIFIFNMINILMNFPDDYKNKMRGLMLLQTAASTVIIVLIPLFILNPFCRFNAGLGIIAKGAEEVILPTATFLFEGLVCSVGSVGSIVGNFSTGLLIGYFYSWTVVFCFGALIWAILMLEAYIWLHSTQDSHPCILLIRSSFFKKNGKNTLRLIKILDNLHLWAKSVSLCSYGCTSFKILTNLLSNTNAALNSNAVSSSLPYLRYIERLGRCISWMLFERLTVYLIANKNNVPLMRLAYNTIGYIIPCAFMVGLAFNEREKILYGLRLFLPSALLQGTIFYINLKVNGQDLSHYHAKLMVAMSSSSGAIGAILSFIFSPIIEYLVQEAQIRWYFVIWISIISNVATVIFSNKYGKAKVKVLKTASQKFKNGLDKMKMKFLLLNRKLKVKGCQIRIPKDAEKGDN